MSNQTWKRTFKVSDPDGVVLEHDSLVSFSVSDFGTVIVAAELWYRILEQLGYQPVTGEE